jgi:hypothetical protein
VQQVMELMSVEGCYEGGSGRGSWVYARVLVQQVMEVMSVECSYEGGPGRGYCVHNPSKIIRPYAPWTRG